MRRSSARFALFVLATVVLLLAMAGPAMANFVAGVPDISSMTNPATGEDAWWHDGWGNSYYPQYESLRPGTDRIDEYPIGFIYRVDRSMTTVVNTATPDVYDRSARITGPNLEQTLDIPGIAANPTGLPWPHYPTINGTPLADLTQGRWVFHYRWFSNKGNYSDQGDVILGLDMTPPNKVQGLQVLPLASVAATPWVPTRRATIKWTPKQYDDLSGVGYYQVLIDGEMIIPETSTSPVQGRVYEGATTATDTMPWKNMTYAVNFHTPSEITIENMPPGQHSVSVQVVDRAGNVGPACDPVTFASDPDTPTITLLSPAANMMTRSTIISLVASDAAGDPIVNVSIDGTGVATMTTNPYAFKPDMTGFVAGPHVLTATVTDRYKRVVTIVRNFTWDPTSGGSTSTNISGLIPSDHEDLNHKPEAVTSSSNPGDIEDPDVWWRQGWGNDLHPDFQITPHETTVTLTGRIIGMLYAVDRNETTTVDPTAPDLYYRAARGTGTNLDGTVDLAGVVNYPPPGGWPPPPAGSTNAAEGAWFVHYSFFTSFGLAASRTWSVPIHLDVTPPRPVENLTASPSMNASDAGNWTAASRTVITWKPSQYDDLSGVGYYQVMIDDKIVLPDSNQLPQEGRVYELPGQTPSSVTIENMPPGKHKITVVAVDRATNRSPESSTYFYSDPDTPTVAIISPTGGSLNATTIIRATASDLGGDPVVTFAIDGSNIATLSGPPYQVKPDMTAFPPGAHTITVTATDHMGRKAVASVGGSSVAIPGQGFIPSPYDSLNTPIDALTTTNGGADPTDPDSWWRNGWGHSLHPQFTITPPSSEGSAGLVIGMLYTIDRNPATQIDPAHPENYSRAARGGGTNIDSTVDLRGILNYPPAGGWPPPAANMFDPIEGTWFFHAAFFTSMGYISTTSGGPFGIDVTPPRAVTGLKASPSLDPSDTATWSPTTRANLSWTPGLYDDLSGVAYYQILVDGEPAVPEGSTNPAQGRVYEISSRTPCSFTIENLSPGQHKLGVVCVDRAVNTGPVATTTFGSDPDTPTISISSPKGAYLTPTSVVAATASDLGGVKNVQFALDGGTLGTVTKAPYSYSPDFSGVSAGSHILSASVTDMLGRKITVNKTITFDPISLKITNMSRTPDPFYPIKRDRYKDNSTISYRINKTATVTLTIRNSAGTTVRTLSSSGVSAGAHSFTWDGKWSSDGKAHVGKFSYQISATDAAGSTATSGKLYTTIKNYELVRLAGNKVKVIPR